MTRLRRPLVCCHTVYYRVDDVGLSESSAGTLSLNNQSTEGRSTDVGNMSGVARGEYCLLVDYRYLIDLV